MGTLYDVLGVGPEASTDELRLAYYRAARRLHPDVNPDIDAEAMRRLNRAWTVLGSPASRRAYDRELQDPSFPGSPAAGAGGPAPAGREEGGAGGPHPGPAEDAAGSDADPGPLARFVRPSVLLIAVLLIIFLVTAYAGPGPGGRSPVTAPLSDAATPAPGGGSVAVTPPAASIPGGTASGGTVSDGTGASRLVGLCLKLQPSSDAVVPCTTPNDGRVVAEVLASDECPPATRPYRLTARDQTVCLDPNG